MIRRCGVDLGVGNDGGPKWVQNEKWGRGTCPSSIFSDHSKGGLSDGGTPMDEVEPFSDFFARTMNALPEEKRYAGPLQAAAERHGLSLERVKSEFQSFKQYIREDYDGVTPVCSFVDDANGQTWDCVPFAQQRGVRGARAKGLLIDDQLFASPRAAAEPRGLPMPGSFPPGATRSTAGPTTSTNLPRPQCPEGTIPVLRITLGSMIPYGTLDHFRSFNKAGPPTQGTSPRG
jgi:hypothetical protein